MGYGRVRPGKPFHDDVVDLDDLRTVLGDNGRAFDRDLDVFTFARLTDAFGFLEARNGVPVNSY